ncbi:MAG: hypothetical protein GY946_14040 [bacterium]|nr:hypothetical protein [bacterium]
MSTAQIQSVGTGRTRTAPAHAPNGFPFGFRRYRSYTLFAATALPMALAAVVLLFGVAALGSGEEAWNSFLGALSSPVAIVISLIMLAASVYFAIRFGWVGRKIAAGRIGPIPGPPLPLPLLGVAPLGGMVVGWLLILAILGGVLL